MANEPRTSRYEYKHRVLGGTCGCLTIFAHAAAIGKVDVEILAGCFAVVFAFDDAIARDVVVTYAYKSGHEAHGKPNKPDSLPYPHSTVSAALSPTTRHSRSNEVKKKRKKWRVKNLHVPHGVSNYALRICSRA